MKHRWLDYKPDLSYFRVPERKNVSHCGYELLKKKMNNKKRFNTFIKDDNIN